MQITLHRSSRLLRNALARALPLAVFFDGQQISTLKTGETQSILLSDRAGVLQVGMHKVDLDVALVRH